MESEDRLKSLLELRTERDRLTLLCQQTSAQLPDQGQNLRRRIASLEDLIAVKREERAKRTTLVSRKFTEASLTWLHEPGLVNGMETQPTIRSSTRVTAKKSRVEIVELSSDSDDERTAARPPPVTSEKNVISLLSNARVVYPESGGRGSVQVGPSDLHRLKPNEFLNDTCIDLYIKRIEQSCPFMDRCYIFRSYFFTKLVESDHHSGSNCRTWTKDVNIFDYDYLFVPVYELAHWSLAIVCFPRRAAEDSALEDSTPCILHLDSIDGHSTSEIGTILRSYLEAEWERKSMGPRRRFHSKNLPTKRLSDVAQQENSADCGLFLLAFLEHFIMHLPPRLDHRSLEALQSEDQPNFLSKGWLKDAHVGLLRTEIRMFIYILYLEQLPAEHAAYEMLMHDVSRYDTQTIPKSPSHFLTLSP